MSKKERFMHASAVFVAALMLLAPLSLGICIDGEEYENVTPENILGENSITDYSGMTQISISEISINGENKICKTSDLTTSLTASDYVITINTPSDLVKFSNLVNGDGSDSHDFSGYTVILTKNIVISDPETQGTSNLDTIGNLSNQFQGTFDGQEYIISNLTIEISEVNKTVYAGLFGYIGINGTVKNVGLVDSSIDVTVTAKVDTESTSNVFSSACAGGIVGWSEGTIENCYNTANVTVVTEVIDENETYDAYSNAHAGGITGENGGTIQNCYNTGDVTATAISTSSDIFVLADAGGITGGNGGTISNCYNAGNVEASGSEACAGGIVGGNGERIQNCYNTGDVCAIDSSEADAGGIAGWNYGRIQNCYNTGDVSAIDSSEADAGGIAGWNGGRIQNCYNTGNISASTSGEDSSEACAGGIVGYNYGGTIQNCYNTGNISASTSGEDSSEACAGGILGYNYGIISNCYNIGDVTSDEYVGGIIGYNYGGIIRNTFYANDDGILGTGYGNTEGTIGLAKNEMIGSCLFSEEYNINVDRMWSPDLLGINNGFPVLTNTPLSLITLEFQSPVYILLNIEKEQVDNFLKLSYTGNSTISAAIMPELQGDFEIKYQWYVYDEESKSFNEIEGAVNDTYTLPNDNNFNRYLVKVTFSNESGESTYASFTRDVQLLEEGHYAIQFNADVIVKDSSGNVIAPSYGTYILQDGNYTYSAVGSKSVENFTVSSSDMFISVEKDSNILYYAIAAVIIILIAIAAFYFIRKK